MFVSHFDGPLRFEFIVGGGVGAAGAFTVQCVLNKLVLIYLSEIPPVIEMVQIDSAFELLFLGVCAYFIGMMIGSITYKHWLPKR